MLISAFLMFLVYSTLNSSIIILNRLGTLTIIFTLILLASSINIVSISPGITLYNNWLSLTPYNLPIMFLILVFSILFMIYSTTYHRYDLKSPFLLVLVLANIIGLLLFPLVNDIIALYIIIELQSYSLYLITGFHNKSYNASRASLLYFFMGSIASATILLSGYYIYSYTGTTNLSDIYIINNYTDTYNYFDILLVALLFKMGMAPLHRWSISVYNYAPTYITLYISIVAKLSIISFIFSNASLFHHHILILFFYISLIIGAYKPLFQINIKNILAYSGILNFSYLLLTIIDFDVSFYIYIIQYTLTHLILFFSILAASQYIEKPFSIWSPLIFINQLKLPNIALAFCFIIALFSLIGIPPLPGFYAKYYILAAAIQDNYILEVCMIVIFSVIATYYYANIIKILIKSNNVKSVNFVNPSIAYILSSSTILLITFFLFLPSLSEGLYLITL